MNKYEATKWMYEQGVGSKVRDKHGATYTLLEGGDFFIESGNQGGYHIGLDSRQEPFTPVLPKKSNEELAIEIDAKARFNGWDRALLHLLDCMDEKIREAK